jgi:hypothetical protein
LFCDLSKNGINSIKLIHKLVALHFIDNPNNKPQINHKDGNKKNNYVDNLEWCTCKQNIIHSYKILKRNPHRQKPVINIITGEIYPNIKKAFLIEGIERDYRTLCHKIQYKMNSTNLRYYYKNL